MTALSPVDDDAPLTMLPIANRLIHAVHHRDTQRVHAAIRDAGSDLATLAIVLAELAPDPAERAAITVLRNADGPADAALLLDALGLAGRAEAAA